MAAEKTVGELALRLHAVGALMQLQETLFGMNFDHRFPEISSLCETLANTAVSGSIRHRRDCDYEKLLQAMEFAEDALRSMRGLGLVQPKD